MGRLDGRLLRGTSAWVIDGNYVAGGRKLSLSLRLDAGTNQWVNTGILPKANIVLDSDAIEGIICSSFW